MKIKHFYDVCYKYDGTAFLVNQSFKLENISQSNFKFTKNAVIKNAFENFEH